MPGGSSFPHLPLRRVVDIRSSNVDKKSAFGETPVRLCNYVDVYKNRVIHSDLGFMRATASEREISRFRLRKGDVVITKDSEAWNDIGVPSLVVTDVEDLVCGYHLAILRPDEVSVLGSYLSRALQVPDVAAQLHVASKGVTRFGLSLSAIGSLRLPVPPMESQKLISRYLDHTEVRVAKAVASQTAVLQGLGEAKAALVAELVKADDVHVYDSGIPGLGPLPRHWRLCRAKYVWRKRDVRSTTGMEERLSVSSARGVVPRAAQAVTMFAAKSYVGHKLVEPGNLAVNSLWAWAGGLGVSRYAGLVSPVYGVYELADTECDLGYMDYLLRSNAMQWQFQVRSKGIWRSRLSLSDEAFFEMTIPIPSLEEQQQIAERIGLRTAALDAAIDSVAEEIALLKEYRVRLISDVVTGKRDVRHEAAGLPEVDPEELAAVLTSGARHELEEDSDATD